MPILNRRGNALRRRSGWGSHGTQVIPEGILWRHIGGAMPYRDGSQLPRPRLVGARRRGAGQPWCLAPGRQHRSDPCSAGATCAASTPSCVTAIRVRLTPLRMRAEGRGHRLKELREALRDRSLGAFRQIRLLPEAVVEIERGRVDHLPVDVLRRHAEGFGASGLLLREVSTRPASAGIARAAEARSLIASEAIFRRSPDAASGRS